MPNKSSRLIAVNVMKTKPGITSYATSRILEAPSSAFYLIFDESMIDTICPVTNREGTRVLGQALNKFTQIEIEAFLGLCILRGVYRSKNKNVRELWCPKTGPPIFSQIMPLNRFEQIRRYLRFDNPSKRQSRQSRDKITAVRLLIDGFVENSQKCYNHNESVTVGEQLYPYRGRCRFIQYMPSKPSKYGLKFWILADSENYYASNVELYTGKDENRPLI